jgi:hypothetical protein
MRTVLGYTFTVKDSGGRTVVTTVAMTPCQGVTEGCVAHAIHHTCHTDFADCKFLHSGVTNAPRGGGGTEDEGVQGCKGEAHKCRVC